MSLTPSAASATSRCAENQRIRMRGIAASAFCCSLSRRSAVLYNFVEARDGGRGCRQTMHPAQRSKTNHVDVIKDAVRPAGPDQAARWVTVMASIGWPARLVGERTARVGVRYAVQMAASGGSELLIFVRPITSDSYRRSPTHPRDCLCLERHVTVVNFSSRDLLRRLDATATPPP